MSKHADTWYKDANGILRRMPYSPSSPPPEWTVILDRTDLSSLTVRESILTADWKWLLNDPLYPFAAPVNLDVVSFEGEKVLEWYCPANTFGGGTSGLSTYPRFPNEAYYTKMYVEYDLYFSGGDSLAQDFAWDLGGKLPGVGGITNPTSVAPGKSSTGTRINSPAGGAKTDYGWGMRGMWVGPGAYSWANNPNEWIGYGYVPSYDGTWGENIQTNYTLPSRQWVTLRQEITLNSVATEGTGDANGIHRMYVNGTKVYEKTNRVYRLYSNVYIDQWQFDFFRGGGDSAWAAPVDSRIKMRRIKLGVGT